MKILIMGGTSSLGNELKLLLAEHNEVITAGRKNCDIHINLNDSNEEIALPSGINTVIHTAANFGGTSDKEILETEAMNVIGTLKLCQAAVRAKAGHFILISSIYASLDERSEWYNIYTLSKKHAEEIARFYCAAHALPLTILRPSPIYGSGERFRKHQPFFYTIVDTAEKAEDLMLYGSNDPIRNYIYIDDLTNIIREIVQQKTEGTYSCTNPANVTYSQIARAAYTAFNTKGSVHFLKDKPSIPDNIFPKDDTLYKQIGIYPRISIEEGVQRIVNCRKGK